MSFLHRLIGKKRRPTITIEPHSLELPGWVLVEQDDSAAAWNDSIGDVVSLTATPIRERPLPLSDHKDLQAYCRGIAEHQGAGLVEVCSTVSVDGPCVMYIYKRLVIPAFRFNGLVEIPFRDGVWMWMVLSGERGTTGVREAVVTAKLMEEGQLSIESYEADWAGDPYDPGYTGVPGQTLRYISDSPEYDTMFPDHPLTKVRRVLDSLLDVPLTRNAS